MKSKDVIIEINQSKKTKNQIEFQRKVYNTYYNIQKPSNSIYNRVPREYTNLNRPYQRMSFNQNQLLDLVFHYQNVIDNMNNNMNNMNNNINNNMSFMNDKYKKCENELNLTKQSLTFTQLQLNSTQQELNSTKQKLNSTQLQLNSTQKELNSTQLLLNSTQLELNSTKQGFDIRIYKINADIKQMNELYTKDISKIKSDFLILNEKLNLSAEMKMSV